MSFQGPGKPCCFATPKLHQAQTLEVKPFLAELESCKLTEFLSVLLRIPLIPITSYELLILLRTHVVELSISEINERTPDSSCVPVKSSFNVEISQRDGDFVDR